MPDGEDTPGTRPAGPEHVDIDMPADPNMLSLARLTVGVVAARADLSLEDVDDLRLAVEELCLMLRRSTESPDRLLLQFTWDDHCVEVHGRFSGSRVGAPDGRDVEWGAALRDTGQEPGLSDELSRQILEALVDEHDIDVDRGAPSGWIRKRRAAVAR